MITHSPAIPRHAAAVRPRRCTVLTALGSGALCLPATVAGAAPPDASGTAWLDAVLPGPLVELQFLGVALWQWIGLVVLALVAGAAAWTLAAVARHAIERLLRQARLAVDASAMQATASPLRLTIGVLFFVAASYTLRLPEDFAVVVNGLAEITTIVALTWLVLRATDVLSRFVEDRAAASQHLARSVVPLGRRTVKVFVVILAALAALQNLGFHVTSLLAGLGIGGLAVALAAQKTVENLFGSMTLIADQPVRVGDFCRFGDMLGTVEDIGLRSTRVRTLDRTVVSIPNGTFASMAIENFGARDRVWLRTSIGLRYETTPDQLRWILVELKALLLAHPKVHPDPARVRFVGFGPHSLDLEIFAYIATTDMNEFHAVREDLLLRIMDVVAASGSSFAFPSQTLYVAPDAGLDAAKRGAAEQQVGAWRSRNALCLPNFPPEQIAALDDTLDYPPAGSAVRAA